MKSFLAVLTVLSVVANLALLGALFAGRDAASEAPATVATSPGAKSAAQPQATDPVWEKITGDDFPTSVQRLRDAGFPPHIVRAIISARVQELFAPRFKALRSDSAAAYWKNATVDPRVRTAEMQLYREQQKMLRDLLGADAEGPDSNIFSRHNLDVIPADKHQAVKDAIRLSEDRRQEVFASIMGGTLTPDMQRKISALEKEHLANLATILSPTELEEFNLRNSQASQNLRYELTAFNPSEEEFRSIYKIWSQIEQPTGGLSQEEMQRRFKAQTDAREQIKGLLGPVRGAEYERAVDFSYRQTSQLVSRLELPAETTTKVWEVKQDIEKRANELRRNTSLPPAERTKQLAALADEGTTRVSSLVGSRGIEAYKTQGAGFWLQNLVPRAPSGGSVPGVITRGP